MHTLFVTEAHEGIINFIDAIPNVVNFGEFSTMSYLFGFNLILAISQGLKLSSKYRTGRPSGGGLVVSALDSGLNGLGSSPGRALRCVLGQDTLLP